MHKKYVTFMHINHKEDVLKCLYLKTLIMNNTFFAFGSKRSFFSSFYTKSYRIISVLCLCLPICLNVLSRLPLPFSLSLCFCLCLQSTFSSCFSSLANPLLSQLCSQRISLSLSPPPFFSLAYFRFHL